MTARGGESGAFAHPREPERADPIDLSVCDREPIHVPGSIQPHGAMIVVRDVDMVIGRVAGDTRALLDHAPEDLVGRSVRELLDEGQIAALRATTEAGGTDPSARWFADRTSRSGAGVACDMLAHAVPGAIVVEFEPGRVDSGEPAPSLAVVGRTMTRMQRAESVLELCRVAVEDARALTGFDRVMVYRFMPDGSGCVVAEDCDPEMEPYLGLHYPASDIPQQARRLYLANWVRLIVDIEYRPAPLIPEFDPDAGGPLDMTHCALRSVSPIHVEYLRNMGVRASMSISIVRDGRLWGLIACHHRQPRHVPHDVRAVCELYGQAFSMQIDSKEVAETQEYRLKLARVHDDLVSHMAGEDVFAEGLIRHRPNLLDYIECDGVAIWADQKLATLGRCPDETRMRALLAWLEVRGETGVFVTDRLPHLCPEADACADTASGLLAIAVSRVPRDYVVWFRPEIVRTVAWAGDPNKPVVPDPRTDRLNPRRSFAAWRETVRLTSRPWLDVEIDAAARLRTALLETVLERTDRLTRALKRAEERQNLLMAELDHRVKNTLANIQALVRHTSGQAESLNDFVVGLERRIMAMSHAQSLLKQTRWQGADLYRIVADELRPHLATDQGNVSIDGAALLLRPQAALTISLALHELATNAAKYGALSRPEGTVRVWWRLASRPDGDDALELSWRERGGPLVREPRRRGFGSLVLERFLAYEFDGRVDLRFAADGLECDIEIPAERVLAPSSDRRGRDHPRLRPPTD